MDLNIHVEVLRKNRSEVRHDSWLKLKELAEVVKDELKQVDKIVFGTKLTQFSNNIAKEHIKAIHICEIESDKNEFEYEILPDHFKFEDIKFQIHPYLVDNGDPHVGLLGSGSDDGEQPACNFWILPSAEFEGMWENLIYDSNIKETLLNYVSSIMFYSEHNVNRNIITWNRLVLLHGPPGTGKTSLCKALAQKLSIRLGNKFLHSELIEINSHSLFSKYFSESGKLVMQMFDKITEHIADGKALVFVLIDEVESLTMSRQNTFGGSDPTDSVRVVNTILTQLDKLKRYPNVLVFTTSNVTGAIDRAFVDRADIKQYIGLPSKFGIYSIFKTCIEELIRVGLIIRTGELELLTICNLKSAVDENSSDANLNSLTLLKISELSEGLSGRALRKIPFLTHAHYIKSEKVNLKRFLNCLLQTVIKFKDDNSAF